MADLIFCSRVEENPQFAGSTSLGCLQKMYKWNVVVGCDRIREIVDGDELRLSQVQPSCTHVLALIPYAFLRLTVCPPCPPYRAPTVRGVRRHISCRSIVFPS